VNRENLRVHLGSEAPRRSGWGSPSCPESPPQDLRGRSRSAAKKADADSKISFARLSPAFPFFRSRISAMSSLLSRLLSAVDLRARDPRVQRLR
jgi:hypothetical protein